jgi:hypothetical protein
MDEQVIKAELQKAIPKAGSIFLLLVQYIPQYPSTYVFREGSSPLMPAEKARILRDQPDEKARWHSRMSEEMEICNLAKARPFLAMRKIRQVGEDSMIGFPVSSLKANNDFGERIRKNLIPHFFYLNQSANPCMHLYKESYVILSTPYIIPLKFFYHWNYIGFVQAQTMSMILEKAGLFFGKV